MAREEFGTASRACSPRLAVAGIAVFTPAGKVGDAVTPAMLSSWPVLLLALTSGLSWWSVEHGAKRSLRPGAHLVVIMVTMASAPLLPTEPPEKLHVIGTAVPWRRGCIMLGAVALTSAAALVIAHACSREHPMIFGNTVLAFSSVCVGC